jgi:hypothetical protein
MKCEICHVREATDTHEVFGGCRRKKSIQYGLQMRVCRQCHTEYQNDYEFMLPYKQKYQQMFIDQYGWDLWWKEMGKSWI